MAERILLTVKTSHPNGNGMERNGGGPYSEGFDIIQDDNEGGMFRSYWSGSDFGVCENCGRYGTCVIECQVQVVTPMELLSLASTEFVAKHIGFAQFKKIVRAYSDMT